MNIIQGPLYTVPSDFARVFFKEFPDYRIRWSFKKRCWLVEQKCGRGSLKPIHVDPHDDQLIRAKDGYWLVMEIQPGDRMPCPVCDNTVRVAVRKFAESRCENCIRHGRDGRFMAGYYPFSESLLEHLRHSDPLRGGLQRMQAEADKANQLRLARAERETARIVEAGTKDAFSRIFDIQSVGYTGSNKFIHLDKGIK